MPGRFTNYCKWYGYPTHVALIAEVWWRLEHVGRYRGSEGGLCGHLNRYAYRQRKRWERIGAQR